MSNQKDYIAWAKARIKGLRDEAEVLEKSLKQFSNFVAGETEDLSSYQPIMTPVNSQRTIFRRIQPAHQSKYAPLLAAWGSKPDKGFTHAELYDLAKKTVKDVANENAVRTYIFSLKREGTIRDEGGKLYINKR